MRCSTSRIESRYSPSLVRSWPPSRPDRAAISRVSPSRMLRSSSTRSCRSSGGVAGAEEPLEHEPRVRLGRQRLGRRLPRHRVHVRARVAVVARADDVVAVDRDLERRQLRVAADQLRDHLVDGRARLDVRALGLLGVHRAHERGGGARMLPAGVALVGRRVVVEPAQHQRVPAEPLHRLQDGGELEPLALGGRGPVPHVHAVAHVDRREPRRARRPRRQGRHHRVEQRQGQGGPHAAQERPSRQRQLRDHHRPAPVVRSRPVRSRPGLDAGLRPAGAWTCFRRTTPARQSPPPRAGL